MIGANDSDGLGHDSFGTKSHGYRALYETLEEMGIKTTRSTTPPPSETDKSNTIVLLGPHPQLMGVEPRYAQELLEWVRQGGRLVVALSEEATACYLCGTTDEEEHTVQNILSLLELSEFLQIQHIYIQNTTLDAESERAAEDHDTNVEDKSLITRITGGGDRVSSSPQVVTVSGQGSLASLTKHVQGLSVNGEDQKILHHEEESDQQLDGALYITDQKDQRHLLAAEFRRGQGSLVVLSDSTLFNNRQLALEDNSILAVHLLTPAGQEVVFDEFYHGLAVRGNPLYLLTHPAFATVALGILLIAGVQTWRSAVFLGPPLSTPPKTRRNIREYIEAMSHFFSRGPGHRRFLIQQIRDGVLSQLSVTLNLPPENLKADKVVQALQRRDPVRAKEFSQVLAEIDALLTAGERIPQERFHSTVQKILECV